MAADLHIHTTFSDGTASPEKVVELSKKAGLKTIAITDHDTVDGIEPALKAGGGIGLEVIPGIEFTAEIAEAEIHILGYFIDYSLPELTLTLKKIQEDRISRIYKICQKLSNLKVMVDPQKILALAGHGSPGRPHVARILKEEGYVSGVKEAFDKYLDFRAPAYVAHYRLTPSEAIKLIISSKGIAVFAHPATSNCDQIIPELIVAGLAGIEAYYPGHDERDIRHYLSLAKKLGLLVTGGSDYHGDGSFREVKLGEISISDELVERLREAKDKV